MIATTETVFHAVANGQCAAGHCHDEVVRDRALTHMIGFPGVKDESAA